MEELYGPISVGLIATLVSVFSQIVKKKLGAESWQAILIVAGMSLFFGGGYHVINMLMKWQSVVYGATWIDYLFLVFGAIVYSGFTWLSAMGIYGVYRQGAE